MSKDIVLFFGVIAAVIVLVFLAAVLTGCADEPSPPPSGIEPDTGTVQVIDVDLGPQVVWAYYCLYDGSDDVMRGCLCILPPDGADKVTVDPKLSWE
jgi:hypothetical protein